MKNISRMIRYKIFMETLVDKTRSWYWGKNIKWSGARVLRTECIVAGKYFEKYELRVE